MYSDLFETACDLLARLSQVVASVASGVEIERGDLTMEGIDSDECCYVLLLSFSIRTKQVMCYLKSRGGYQIAPFDSSFRCILQRFRSLSSIVIEH